MSAQPRPLVAGVKRDAISWWAEVRYADQRPYEVYIRSTPCLTERGARRTAKRLLKRYVADQERRGIEFSYVVARAEVTR